MTAWQIRGVVMTREFVNIAGYRFISIPDRVEMRWPLRDFCVELGMKGTILLSEEGINFFVSGTQECFQELLHNAAKDEIPGSGSLTIKI